jgi:hypothetical protein
MAVVAAAAAAVARVGMADRVSHRAVAVKVAKVAAVKVVKAAALAQADAQGDRRAAVAPAVVAVGPAVNRVRAAKLVMAMAVAVAAAAVAVMVVVKAAPVTRVEMAEGAIIPAVIGTVSMIMMASGMDQAPGTPEALSNMVRDGGRDDTNLPLIVADGRASILRPVMDITRYPPLISAGHGLSEQYCHLNCAVMWLRTPRSTALLLRLPVSGGYLSTTVWP